MLNKKIINLRITYITWSFVLSFAISISLACTPTKEKDFKDGYIIEAKVLNPKEKIKVKIKIAPNLHAYLDKGKRGVLIPISFDWEMLKRKNKINKKPQLISTPSGEYESKAEANVLRKQGSFIFEGMQLENLVGEILRVRIQLCDEISGICYRPKWAEVAITAEKASHP